MASGFSLEGAFTIRNVHVTRPDNSLLLGEAEIFGALHLVTFIKVEDVPAEGPEATRQVGVGDAARLYEALNASADESALQSVAVPGFSGEYVISIQPQER